MHGRSLIILRQENVVQKAHVAKADEADHHYSKRLPRNFYSIQQRFYNFVTVDYDQTIKLGLRLFRLPMISDHVVHDGNFYRLSVSQSTIHNSQR